jgi:peptidoglycan/LPS O-acetylase OafA/YrhL
MENNTTIESYYDKKNNSFTILSIIMSLLIVFFHSYPLYYGSGIFDPISDLLGTSIGSIVVDSFLIISGFHITTSLQKKEKWYIFWTNRFFKLLPSLILYLLISTFVICPLILNIPYIDYIKTQTYYLQYIKDNLLLWHNTSYRILDIFSGNPYPYVLNGSIWTIKHFLFCYIFLFIIKIIGKLDDKKFLLFLFFILLFINLFSIGGVFDGYYKILSATYPNIGIIVEFNWFVNLLFFFMTGVIINLYSNKIHLDTKFFIALLFFWFVFKKLLLLKYAILFLLPYIIIYVGTKKSKIKFYDISYNVYVFSFFIQQLIIYYLHDKINFGIYIILCLVINVAFGLLLYFAFDKNVKRIKDKFIRTVLQ